MDTITLVFVFALFAFAFLLTIMVRRDFLAKERSRRELRRQAQHVSPARELAHAPTNLPRPRLASAGPRPRPDSGEM